jgi:hypothetical protein
MNVVQPVTLHCKVKVRKYVLVSDPTRWKRKGERIVVQSPMLDIPKSVSHVPVKRYVRPIPHSILGRSEG